MMLIGHIIGKGNKMKVRNIRYHGFIEIEDTWVPFDKVIPTTNEEPLEDIQEALKQLDIKHYLVTYEEIKNG